jgi:hypothetical protein
MNVSGNKIPDFFSGLMENRVSKIVSLIFSAVGAYLVILFIYSIIWYQKFGSDDKQTLLNRLYINFWGFPLLWLATVQQVDITR